MIRITSTLKNRGKDAILTSPPAKWMSAAPKAALATSKASSTKSFSTRTLSSGNVIPLVAVSLAAGFFAGRQSLPVQEQHEKVHHLPNGLPRTCCDAPHLTEKQVQLHKILKRIVGKANVLDGRVETTETSPYIKGARLGKGSALYIVKPTKLKQLIEIVQAVVDADCVVLVQGQNTGLVSIFAHWFK